MCPWNLLLEYFGQHVSLCSFIPLGSLPLWMSVFSAAPPLALVCSGTPPAVGGNTSKKLQFAATVLVACYCPQWATLARGSRLTPTPGLLFISVPCSTSRAWWWCCTSRAWWWCCTSRAWQCSTPKVGWYALLREHGGDALLLVCQSSTQRGRSTLQSILRARSSPSLMAVRLSSAGVSPDSLIDGISSSSSSIVAV